ncbi:hypothetical protein MRX96_056907 [Rhipicephalus microplus]
MTSVACVMTRNLHERTPSRPTGVGRQPALKPKVTTPKQPKMATYSSNVRPRTESALSFGVYQRQPPQIKQQAAVEQVTPALLPLKKHQWHLLHSVAKKCAISVTISQRTGAGKAKTVPKSKNKTDVQNNGKRQ